MTPLLNRQQAARTPKNWQESSCVFNEYRNVANTTLGVPLQSDDRDCLLSLFPSFASVIASHEKHAFMPSLKRFPPKKQ
jgi:hypothetical protein